MLFYGAVSSFLVTVALISASNLHPTWYWWGVCITALLLVLICVRQGLPKLQVLFTILIIVGASLLAWGRVEMVAADLMTSPLQKQVSEEVTLTGVVNSEVDTRNNFQQFTVQIDGEDILLRTDPYQKLNYGDLVIVSGRLEKPASFVTELGRTFDYPGYLKAKGISYQMSFANIELVEPDHGQVWLATLYKAKQYFMTTLESFLPEPAAGLSEGLLLGVKQALGEELETAFRKTGIIHIVVLSGYNVMLVVVFVTTVLSFFLGLRGRVIFGIFAIATFALLVGPSATVVRASIMASLYLVAQMLGRNYEVMRGLFFAAVAMVFINPYILLYDIGFQLSFMATLGLLMVAPHFESLLVSAPRFLGVRDFFIATVSTQIAVAPLLLYHIGELSLVAVIVNMLVLPLVPVAMLGTFIVGMLGMLYSTAAWLVAYPTYIVLHIIITIAMWFSTVPYATITVPEFSSWWIGLGYILLAAALYAWQQRANPQPVTPYAIKLEQLTGWTIEKEKILLERFMANQQKNNSQS